MVRYDAIHVSRYNRCGMKSYWRCVSYLLSVANYYARRAIATPYTSKQYSISELMCFSENKLLMVDGIRLTTSKTLLPVTSRNPDRVARKYYALSRATWIYSGTVYWLFAANLPIWGLFPYLQPGEPVDGSCHHNINFGYR